MYIVPDLTISIPTPTSTARKARQCGFLATVSSQGPRSKQGLLNAGCVGLGRMLRKPWSRSTSHRVIKPVQNNMNQFVTQIDLRYILVCTRPHTPRHIHGNFSFKNLTIVDTTISERLISQVLLHSVWLYVWMVRSLNLILTFLSYGVCSLSCIDPGTGFTGRACTCIMWPKWLW